MKITEFSDEILFDEFPKIFNPTQKVFITHLYNADKLVLPKRVPKIYTSNILAQQLITFFGTKGNVLSFEEHFIILKPFEPMELRMSDCKKISVLPCEEDEEHAGINLMILIRFKNTLKHFYAGNCVKIRRSVLNKTFIDWVGNGVPKFYMNLKRATSYDPQNRGDSLDTDGGNLGGTDADEVIESIKQILRQSGKVKARIEVPIFGYESLLARFAENSRARVAAMDILWELCQNVVNKQYFQTQVAKAKFIFNPHSQTMDEIKHCYHFYKCIYIKITDGPAKNNAESNKVYGYYEVQWSPLPSPKDAIMLMTLLHPMHIYDSRDKLAKIPGYLWELREQKHKPQMRVKNSSSPDANVTPSQMKKTLLTTSPAGTAYARRRKALRYVDATADDSDTDSD